MATPKEIQEMITLLVDDPESTQEAPAARADALQELVDMGAEAVPFLIKGLASPFNAYISRALKAIGEPSIDPLIAALTDESNGMRRANAAFTLGRMEVKRAVPNLIAALEDNNDEVRKQAAMTLAVVPHKDAVLPLCDALTDPDPEVQSRAALALGAHHDERAVEPLKDLFLKSDEEPVRRAAQTALKQLGHDPKRELLNVDPSIGVRAKKVLSDSAPSDTVLSADTLGIPRVELLIATLESTDVAVQRRAARELVRLGEKAVMPLIAALKSQNPTVQAHAAWALGELGDKRAIDYLQEAKKASDESVRYSSQKALEKLV